MGYITGIVRDTTNAPLEDVNMIIVSGPPHPDIVAITDAEGRFGFDNLRPGKYVLKAYGRLESDDIPVQVRANQPPFVEIWLGSAPAPPPSSSAEESYLINEENSFDEEGYQRDE
ncbi:carboxypeptidase-like regulatory domain-containing protein [Hymenobacter rigui]|nr:carboxypeptidase-like regulatory domain-containing protein [Hymenobacter rigui]